jgi:hypothetical protein
MQFSLIHRPTGGFYKGKLGRPAAMAAQIAQLAISYRDSPLSASYLQEGLHAGDRVPDLVVRYHREDGGFVVYRHRFPRTGMPSRWLAGGATLRVRRRLEPGTSVTISS